MDVYIVAIFGMFKCRLNIPKKADYFLMAARSNRSRRFWTVSIHDTSAT
tara:strand:- start:43 stop:189 length:147 start_codon:yes stop_codon:yes gene_type:complete